MKYDVLAVGDPTIDCFIRLKDARVTCSIDDEKCELCVRFGDKVPFEFALEVPAGGNAANASVACAKLGITSTFSGSVGDDDNGKRIIEAFRAAGVATELIRTEAGKTTNYHYVLWYESERTILIKHEHFSYALPALEEPPAWIYLSSLGEGTEAHQHELAAYTKEYGVKLAFQPGTYQMKLGTVELADVYAATEIFFCNKEESQRILGTAENDIKALLDGIRALGPKVAVITDGRKGASIQTDKGSWHAPMYPDPKPPVERTGAGDATASTTVAYIIQGLAPEEALLRGLINGAYVVQEIGAQKGLLSKERLEELYASRPSDFVLTPLT